MGASHHHDHKSHRATSNIRVAFILNLSFTVIEIVGGVLTNSMAVLSDALHDLGDSISLGISWYLEKYSDKKRDSRYTYGYARFSILSALISAVVLISGSIFILTKVIPRLFDPVLPDTSGMIWLALLGILFNGVAALRVSRGKSLNEQMVSWHLFEDVIGWVGVLIIGVIMKYYHVPILDGLFSILFTLFILFNVTKVLRETLKILLQGRPDDLDTEKLVEDLQQIPNILSSHDLRIWSLDEAQVIMTVHLVVPDHSSKQDIIEIKSQVSAIAKKHSIAHVTTEIEYEDEICKMSQT